MGLTLSRKESFRITESPTISKTNTLFSRLAEFLQKMVNLEWLENDCWNECQMITIVKWNENKRKNVIWKYKKLEYYATFEFLNNCNQITFSYILQKRTLLYPVRVLTKHALQANLECKTQHYFLSLFFGFGFGFICTFFRKWQSLQVCSKYPHLFFSIFKFFGNSAPHLWHICRLYFLCKRTWVLFPTCLKITLSILIHWLRNTDTVIVLRNTD